MTINADAPKSEEKEIRKTKGKILRKVTVKIELERINM